MGDFVADTSDIGEAKSTVETADGIEQVVKMRRALNNL